MKKNRILSGIVALTGGGLAFLLPNGWMYGLTAILILLGALVATRWKGATHLAKWANRNPRKTQVLLALAQLAMMAQAMLMGHSLYQLGIEVSMTTFFVFGALTMTGYLSTPFLKRMRYKLPMTMRRHQVIYMGIALCGWGGMTYIGNHMERDHADLWISQAVMATDTYLHATSSDDTPREKVLEESIPIQPVAQVSPNNGAAKEPSMRELRRSERRVVREQRKAERRQARERKKRMRILAMQSGGMFGFVLLMGFCSCMGICITGFGIAFAVAGGITGIMVGILGIALGPLIAWGSVRAIFNRFERYYEYEDAS